MSTNVWSSLHEVVRPTTIIESPRLARRLSVKLTIVTESFQHTGSFKFRAAYNVVTHIAQPAVITASSGNFGQAMAYACGLKRKSCTVVMPSTSALVKIEAVREYGGTVDLVDTDVKSRAQRVNELVREHPEAYVASAYDDPLVIEGNASLGREIAALDQSFDCVVVPIGGGGLSSGIITGLRWSASQIPVIAAEPALSNDAAQSLRAGQIVCLKKEVRTIADGARTLSIGQHNWAVLRDGLSTIVEVSEENIKEGVRLLFSLANLKAEPTAALGVGALLEAPHLFHDRSVCCVVSGGNVDSEVYRNILAGH